MTALIENGAIIEEYGLGSTLQADGETGADADGIHFKTDNNILWENDLGTSDFTSTMTLVITGLEDSGALFLLYNNAYNGFELWDGDLNLHGLLCKACLSDLMLLCVCHASAADNKLYLCMQ